jgi:hypothetical protein
MAWCLVKHRDNFTFYLDVLTAMMIYIEVLWVVIPCSVAVDTNIPKDLATLHPQGEGGGSKV